MLFVLKMKLILKKFLGLFSQKVLKDGTYSDNGQGGQPFFLQGGGQEFVWPPNPVVHLFDRFINSIAN